MIKVVYDNLFNAKEKYLCHQCNCVTNKAAHLAKDVFSKYPYADIYSERQKMDGSIYIEHKEPLTKPGSIIIRGNGLDQRYIINLLGQYYPGKPQYINRLLDSPEIRENYFYKTLLCIAKIPNLESIAFPWKIGCGAAGGNWDNYLGNITNFAKYIYDQQKAEVVIYRLDTLK